MTGLSSVPAAYTPSVPSNTLYVDGHEDLLHQLDRTNIRALILEVWALGKALTINGNMDHFQRTGSGTTVPTTTFNVLTSFAADRIFVRPAGASLTSAGRSATVPDAKSQYSLSVVGAASVTTVDIGQRIRAAIIATHGLQSLVFSANVRNVSGSAFTPKLRIGTPGAVDDHTTVTNRLDQALQSCADSAWTRVYHVFDPSAYTNIANGMECVLQIPSGSSVAGDTNHVAQFDLRPGTALAPYIPPDPDEELFKSLRYTRVFGGETTVDPVGSGVSISTTSARAFAPLNPPMRVAPTLGVSAVSDWAVIDGSASNVALSNLTINTATTQGVNFTCTVASGLTAGQGTILRAASTANARLYLHAELT